MVSRLKMYFFLNKAMFNNARKINASTSKLMFSSK